MDNLHWLDKIQPFDRMLVGDEAFYLSHIVQRGYPAVPGFVVPASATRTFLETVHWSEPLLGDLPHSSLHLNINNSRQMQQIAQQIRQDIIATDFPQSWVSEIALAQERYAAPVWILRPSLALLTRKLPKDTTGEKEDDQAHSPSLAISHSSMSELLEAYLVKASPGALAMGLKSVYAELFRARSLFYWQSSGIELEQLNLAVLVQPVWNAIASGSVYATSNGWEIQATWGLYESLRLGEVIPDSYFVQPETGVVQTRQLGVKTRAYRLTDPAFVVTQASFQLNESCLEAYVLSEEQQEQFALPANVLGDLIQLTRQLTRELGSTFALEWTLATTEEDSEPQLYLTQVKTLVNGGSRSEVSSSDETPDNPTTVIHHASITDPQNLMKGLAASSGRVLALVQVLTNDFLDNLAIPPGKILVAKSVAPDWLPLIKQAAGLVIEQGGLTSHAAIIARELGIPAVVGVASATQLIQTGESILIDGDQGHIYRGVEQEAEAQQPEKELSQPVTYSSFPTLQFPIATQLLVNLSQSSSLTRTSSLPVDGIGLLRSELMLVEGLNGQHPSQWLEQGRNLELVELLAQLIGQFASSFAPRPVFYRSLDLRSHEFLGGRAQLTPEVNPMLGVRGTFSYLFNPALFDLELAAIAQLYHSGYTNIHLILPFVRTVEEFSFCRHRVEQAGLTQYSQFQLWIMAEVPSILFLLPDYVKAGVQGISIGTNDLTQLVLGVDRDQAQMAVAFDECHPAVMRAVKQLIQLSKEAGIPCSICGQAPARYPELINQLIAWGITSISVEPDAVERTYTTIARAEQRLLLEAARRQLNSSQ